MPHSKLPEQELAEMYDRLGEIKSELPDTPTGDVNGELTTAMCAVNRVQTDIARWREFVDDSEVLDE